MATTQHSDDLIGGRYRLTAPIASGGMADVWRATDLTLHREVAIKLLRKNVVNDPVVAERFRREARALAKLHHPNIVPVYDTIEENGQVALVMRYIDGMSLRELLDEAGTDNAPGVLSVYTTVHIGRAIAAALAKAHSENLVHRDIKPGNILITPNGDVLLTDFGIAKPLKASEGDELHAETEGEDAELPGSETKRLYGASDFATGWFAQPKHLMRYVAQPE